MGLFSSKKKTVVNTSVARMVNDEDIIPSNKMAVLDYTMSQNSSSTRLSTDSLPDYLLKATTNNIVARARKSIKYASKDHYSYGQLKSNLVTQDGVDVKGAVQDSLERIYPEGVVVFDAYFGPMNNYYFLRPILQEKYGYDYDTNELVEESRRIGFPCYMESAVIKYSHYTTAELIDPETVKQVGPSAESGYTPFRPANPKAKHVPWVNDYEGDYDIAEITAVYKDSYGVKRTYKFAIDYLAYEPSSKPEEGGLDDDAANVIDPDAEATPEDDNLLNKDFFQANYQYTQNGETKTGVFIYLYGSGLDPTLDRLFNVADTYGTYIPRIYARMYGRKCNANGLKDTPNYKSMVGLCKQLGMQWSNWVNELHNSIGSLEYVTQIFMTYSLPANTSDPLIREYMFEYFMGLYGRIPNRFATSAFNNLGKEVLSYGSKAGQSIRIRDRAYSQVLSFSSIGYMDIAGKIGPIGTVASGMAQNRTGTSRLFGGGSSRSTYHWYRKQLTTNTYREVRVYSLALTENVAGTKSTTASGGSENLLIPLDTAVNHEFNMRDKEMLYNKSMYVVIHTKQVIKTKWYQTGIFKAIMFIVAVVVAYFFPPAGAAVAGWMAVAYAVVQTVVISLVIQVAVKLLVKLGVDVGMVAAVIAVIAIIYGGYVGLTRTAGTAGITTTQALNVASQAFSISSQGFALQTAKAVKEHNSLMADLTEEQKEIERHARELGLGAHGPLLMFEPPVSIGIRMGESPDDYFERSAHTFNLASAIYSVAENHVDMTLSLPSQAKILNNIQEYTNHELPIIRL